MHSTLRRGSRQILLTTGPVGKGVGGGSGLLDSQFSNKARNPDFPVKNLILKFWQQILNSFETRCWFAQTLLLATSSLQAASCGGGAAEVRKHEEQLTAPATDLQRTHQLKCQAQMHAHCFAHIILL